MAIRCSICIHPKRVQIDRAIVNGDSIASIARNFGVGYDPLASHAKNHVSRQMSQAWEKKSLDESFNLLGRIDNIMLKAEDIFKRNYAKKNDGLALKALSEQRSTIELLAKISYSLHQAKLAEIELSKQESGANEFEMQQNHEDDLKILSQAEMIIYNNLVNKVANQDHKIDILQLGDQTIKVKFGEQEHEVKLGLTKMAFEDLKRLDLKAEQRQGDKRHTSSVKTHLKRTKGSQTKPEATLLPTDEEVMTPKPIPAQEIPYTRFSDGPYNRRRR